MKRKFEITDDYPVVKEEKVVKIKEPRNKKIKEDKINPDNNNPNNLKGKKPKKSKGLIFQRFIATILVISVVMLAVASTGVMLFANKAWAKNPEMFLEDFTQRNSTKFYNDAGEEIYDLGLKVVDNIEYEDLSQTLIDALLAVEDSRFFEHDGVDLPRFTKAMLTNGVDTIKNRRLMFSQGGSTITMQLIKNTYFTKEDHETGESIKPASSGVEGVERKFQELNMAKKLERDGILDKKNTIALYLNTINFGARGNILGVQNSSEKYFGKDVSDLTLIVSAFLAGVINSPNNFSPYTSIVNAQKRTQVVLDLMLYHGYITEAEHLLASRIDLENIFVDRSANDVEGLPNQAYIDVVVKELKEMGYNPTETPMRVYTSMNSNIQESIDKIQKREIPALDYGANRPIQIGSSITNNKTGEIVGIVGGYDYDAAALSSNAYDQFKNPASIMKPLLSYPLGFEYLGYSYSHTLRDEPYVYAGTQIVVENWDKRYLGDISLEWAFNDSRNTVALQMLDDAKDVMGGGSKVVKYLNDMGFSKAELYSPQMAIGGDKMVTNPVELSGALATIMNGGEHIKPHTVKRIEFFNGSEPITNNPIPNRVLSDASTYLTSRLMNSRLKGNIWLAPLARGYETFAKTGTHRYDSAKAKELGAPSSGISDKTMLASTSEYSIATWAGFTKYDPATQPWITPSEEQKNIPGKINSYLIDQLEKEFGVPGAIPRPDSVVDITHILGTFPYQSPAEGMNPNLISSKGMIKKEFFKLVEPTPQTLKNLDSLSVEATQVGTNLDLAVQFAPYPDAEKLIEASSTLQMKIPFTDRTVNGKRIYDDSWVYGPVRYKVEILVDGAVINVIKSETDAIRQTIAVPRNGNLEVRGSYIYDYADSIQSNVITKAFELKNTSTAVPTFSNQPFSTFASWAQTNNMQFEVDYKKQGSPALAMTVRSTNPSIENSEQDLDQLRQSKIVVTLHDFEVKAENYPTFESFKTGLGAYLNIVTPPDTTGKIKEFSFNGETDDDFLISEVGSSEITVIFE